MMPSRAVLVGAVLGALLGAAILIAVMPRGIARLDLVEPPAVSPPGTLERIPEPSRLPAAEAVWAAILGDSAAMAERAGDRAAARYNLGTVVLAQGRHDDAAAHLQVAARSLPDARRRFAHFNLGNTDLAPAFADSLLPEREARLRRSIEAYKAALLGDPSDLDAKCGPRGVWEAMGKGPGARRGRSGEPPPRWGGGGGGGGGGNGPPEPGATQPAPSPAEGGGPQPSMSPAEAEELLRSAQERELQVQRESLRKPQPPGPIRP
jgi:tetratricopeptide (TPR) repeat protein